MFLFWCAPFIVLMLSLLRVSTLRLLWGRLFWHFICRFLHPLKWTELLHTSAVMQHIVTECKQHYTDLHLTWTSWGICYLICSWLNPHVNFTGFCKKMKSKHVCFPLPSTGDAVFVSSFDIFVFCLTIRIIDLTKPAWSLNNICNGLPLMTWLDI